MVDLKFEVWKKVEPLLLVDSEFSHKFDDNLYLTPQFPNYSLSTRVNSDSFLMGLLVCVILFSSIGYHVQSLSFRCLHV